MADDPRWAQEGLLLREGRDDDRDGLVELIGLCFSAYDNCVLDLDGIDSELNAIHSHFDGLGGQFWVLTEAQGGRIVGCIGWSPHDDGVELKKLYVHPDWRRRGLARRLVGLVEQAAAKRGAAVIDLWSDTRFTEAHALYTAFGFVQGEETRHLNDPSDTTEFYFRRETRS